MERKLAAILSADVEGYSRLMGDDEEATIRTLTAYREVMAALIEQHRGRVVDSPGDNLLAEFASAVDAVEGAVAVQLALEGRNAGLPPDRRMAYRVGINVGDVVVEGERIYGDGVNIAARLESLAEGGGICISGNVHEQIKNKIALAYEYQGEQTVKNIADPVRVYKVELEPGERVSSPNESRPASLPAGGDPSIAVLPFNNMSGDPEQEYFSDGITEDLITDLSNLSELFVIARNSAFTYKGRSVNIQSVGKELGVRYVVEGSVRKAGNRVRITAQLIDAASGMHLWAERYDRELDDIFALQDEVTRQIVRALEVKLTTKEQAQMESNPTDNVEAYDSYLRGVEQFNLRTRAGIEQARKLFERATALDPKYAAAYAYLARTYISARAQAWDLSPETLQRASELGRMAVALDESLPLAHLALGFAHLWKKEHGAAIAEAERAVALNPRDAEALGALGDILNYAERPEEAIRALDEAVRIDPKYPVAYLFNLGRAYFLLGQNEKAAEMIKRVLTRNPDHLPSRAYLVPIYLALGREAEGRAEWRACLQRNPNLTPEFAGLLPYQNQALLERITSEFRRAGLD